MTDAPKLLINRTRVRDAAGYRGTVAYVGPVASASDPTQIYAGIIWDDPQRGKHNGSVVAKSTGELVSHFSCPHPTGASFVKVPKLDLGTILTPDVLLQRYVTLDSTLVVAPNNVLPHTAATVSGKNNKPIELLGELKIREYQQVPDLPTLSLRLCGLAGMNVSADWTTAQHVKTLDLAGNLFHDWSILGQVLTCFPSLETLSLASNRLGDLEKAKGILQPIPLENQKLKLRTLNVRDCHIGSVQTLLALGQLLPQLHEIGMGQARLTDMDATKAVDLAKALPNLQVLDLSQGQLESHNVEALAVLPSLQSLSLDDNPLQEWKPVQNGFTQLVHLQLAGTLISSWSALDGLTLLPKLQSLRLRCTPLTESVGAAAVRSQLIARFPSLTVLNASSISLVERQEAERRYVANVTRLLHSAKSDDDKAEILAQHATYPRLAQEHATVLESIHAQATGGNGSHLWSDSLATVTIRSMAAQSCEQPPLVRRLPAATLTVGKVKALLARHFGLDWDLQELFMQNTEKSIPTLLDQDDQTLAYFGLADGATIFMHEVDVRARQQELERQEREQADKMKQKEQELKDYVQIQKKVAGT